MISKKIKRIFITGLCTTLIVLSLGACTGNENTNNMELNSGAIDNEGDLRVATGNGRFIETERLLPEEMCTIVDMVLLDDGTIRLIDQLGMLFDSSDGGVTFELSSFQLDLPCLNIGGTTPDTEIGETFIFAAALNSNGSVFLSYEAGHVYVNSNGDVSMVEIELPIPDWAEDLRGGAHAHRLQRVSFTSDNNIIGMGIMPDLLYLIDPASGQIIMTFGDEESNIWFLDFTELNGKLLAITSEGLDSYDLESGRLLELDQPLQEFFAGFEQQFMGFGSATPSRLFTGVDENTLFFVDATGLYRYVLGGSQIEQLINGNLTTMSNPSYGLSGAIEIPDNSFLISYWGIDSQRLMDYTFDAEADAVPNEEITVFSMFENHLIRQAISTFQANNPHLLVQYEVGLSDEDSGLTMSDVISSLNTRIMAGTGPDILILDGLPYESYIINGVLLELSELVESLKLENDYFENILEFGKVDGEIHFVPATFNLLAAAGAIDTLSEVTNLSNLADLVEYLRSTNPDIETIMGAQAAETLLKRLLHYSYLGLYNNDGTMNPENLSAFLENVSRIHHANMTPEAYAELMDKLGEFGMFTMSNFTMSNFEPRIALDFNNILNGEQKLCIGATTSFFEFDLMVSVLELASWDYKMRNEFLPTNLIGINAGSTRLEESKEFFKFLLGESTQTATRIDGFPVMIAGFEGQFDGAGITHGGVSVIGIDGEAISLDITGASIEQINRLIQEIKQVIAPSVPNQIILDVINREGVSFLNGEQSLEEAVEGILSSVNLFLAE